MKKIVSLLLASMLVFAFGANADASPADRYVVESIAVDYSDLRIDTEAGARTLYARLKHASNKVCGVESYWQLGSLTRVKLAHTCYDQTLGKAVANIDSDALTKLHTG